MYRLGEGREGLMKSVAIATLAPGGSVAVGSALVLDEVKKVFKHLTSYF